MHVTCRKKRRRKKVLNMAEGNVKFTVFIFSRGDMYPWTRRRSAYHIDTNKAHWHAGPYGFWFSSNSRAWMCLHWAEITSYFSMQGQKALSSWGRVWRDNTPVSMHFCVWWFPSEDSKDLGLALGGQLSCIKHSRWHSGLYYALGLTASDRREVCGDDECTSDNTRLFASSCLKEKKKS